MSALDAVFCLALSQASVGKTVHLSAAVVWVGRPNAPRRLTPHLAPERHQTQLHGTAATLKGPEVSFVEILKRQMGLLVRVLKLWAVQLLSVNVSRDAVECGMVTLRGVRGLSWCVRAGDGCWASCTALCWVAKLFLYHPLYERC